MPTYEQMYTFLKIWYKHDRFEGRNMPAWGYDYAKIVTASSMLQLERLGYGIISQYESSTGKMIRFNTDLEIDT